VVVRRGAASTKSRACWLCGAPALEAQQICWQCGAELSPEAYAANAQNAGDEERGFLPAPQTPGSASDVRELPPVWADELPSRDRRASFTPAVSAVINVLFAAGFGILGALIGGGIWFIVVTTIHFELGFFAVLMGFLIGRGIVLGSTMHGFPPALLAAGLTFWAYAVCIVLIHGQGIQFNLVDIPSVLATFLIAMGLPMLRAPHET
jgi:hypothetical protein